MTYLEFRKASYRHLKTCDCLLESIDNKSCKNKERDIIVNTFYLSGYVIECSLKFVLFSTIQYNQNEDIYNYKCGICRNCMASKECTEWKHHNLAKLQQVIEDKGVKFSQDIPILGSNYKVSTKIKNLFYDRNDPKMQIRYSYNNQMLNKELLKEYIEVIRDINTKLINRFS